MTRKATKKLLDMIKNVWYSVSEVTNEEVLQPG